MWQFLTMANKVNGSHISIVTRVLQAVKSHFALLATKEVGHINLIPIINGSIRENLVFAEAVGFPAVGGVNFSSHLSLLLLNLIANALRSFSEIGRRERDLNPRGP